MRLIAFGNSQVHWIFAQSPEVEKHRLESWTMHRIGRDGASFVEERADIAGACKIIFVYGGVDVRCHLVRFFREGGERPIADLADRYLRSISAIRRSTATSSKLYVLGVVPPIDPLEIDPELPPFGSISERVIVRRLLNRSMARLAASHGVAYIPMPRSYETLRGSMRMTRSDGQAHIAMDEAGDVVRAVSLGTGETISFPRTRWATRTARFCLRVKALARRDVETMWRLGETRDDMASPGPGAASG